MTAVPLPIRILNVLRALGMAADPGTWIIPGQVFMCAYPRSRRSLARLEALGIRRLLNLHMRGHESTRLGNYGLSETHVPIPDFEAPASGQLAAALRAIHSAVQENEPIAVHCAGGLGRAGTVLACYLVDQGHDWRAAVRQVRSLRPGAIETRAQLESIAEYAECRSDNRGAV